MPAALTLIGPDVDYGIYDQRMTMKAPGAVGRHVIFPKDFPMVRVKGVEPSRAGSRIEMVAHHRGRDIDSAARVVRPCRLRAVVAVAPGRIWCDHKEKNQTIGHPDDESTGRGEETALSKVL